MAPNILLVVHLSFFPFVVLWLSLLMTMAQNQLFHTQSGHDKDFRDLVYNTYTSQKQEKKIMHIVS